MVVEYPALITPFTNGRQTPPSAGNSLGARRAPAPISIPGINSGSTSATPTPTRAALAIEGPARSRPACASVSLAPALNCDAAALRLPCAGAGSECSAGGLLVGFG